MAKVLWQGGFGALTPEEQAERNRAALAYQAAIDESRAAFALAGICALAAVAVLVKTHYYPSYSSNKGHRVPRNRHATIRFSGRSPSDVDKVLHFMEGRRSGVSGIVYREGKGYQVPMAKASEVMSKLRRKFAKDISKGRIKIKLVREGKWPRGRRIGKGA